jgi:hypothetical protein
MQRLEVSGAVRPIYESLGVKRLRNNTYFLHSGNRRYAFFVGVGMWWLSAQHSATTYHTDRTVVLQPAIRTLPNIIRYKPQHTTITEQCNDVVNRHYSRKLLKMDILMFETC